jgi:transposase
MSTVTILSGPERRRRWSTSKKTRIVAESLAPGAVVTAVAQRHDVHPNLLHHWRRQAKLAGGGGRQHGFLPVMVTTPSGPEATAAGSPEATAAGSIEIELGAVRVRVDAAVDEAALGRVLRALGR